MRWGGQERTQDIGFAQAGKAVALVLPSDAHVKTDEAIESLQMGFLPVTGPAGKEGGAYLVPDEPAFRLDFLRPLHRGGSTPYRHPQLNVTLQPLPFMEYSLEQGKGWVARYKQGAAAPHKAHPEIEVTARLATAV